MGKVDTKLNFYFALMASLSGLTFLGTPELGSLPFIAVFFAVFGLIFVDLLKWFALPPVMAYLALGGIAFYTINRFYTIGSFSPEPQMIAVAELLVFVQSVLMLQTKNKRIYEQLAVFAMLQLIVAAIFNNAITYGLLLLPLGIIAIGALSLLHIRSVSEDVVGDSDSVSQTLRLQSHSSQQSFAAMATVLPRVGWLTIAPSVIVVAMVFFYALPRTNETARSGIGGKAQIGFSSQVKLGQIGLMMRNPEIAVRMDLSDRRSGGRYSVVDDIYIRGVVLERYNPTRNFEGTWAAIEGPFLTAIGELPSVSLNNRNSRGLADDVTVKMTVSSMKSESLFSIAPYYYDSSGRQIVHEPERWLIRRRDIPLISRNSQIFYRFGTQAFRVGIQSPYLPRSIDNTAEGDEESNDKDDKAVDEMARMDREIASSRYVRECLDYDDSTVPSAARVALTALGGVDAIPDDNVQVAKQMERYLSSGVTYQYTLDLTMEPIIGMDPIEQFLTVNRRGNCQYFASALVLMLRSQGIPARLVVGFSTDEYNTLGGYYVARQSHAHAWVEALVNADAVKSNDLPFPRSKVKEYWLRLDPTPGGGGTNFTTGGSVSNVLDLAQDIWTNYVVDADASDRRRELGGGLDGMSSSYASYYEWFKLKISRVRAGELGAGALADGPQFSWLSAILVIAILLLGLIAYQVGPPNWLARGSDDSVVKMEVQRPTIPFFVELMTTLESIGIVRRIGQTPLEYTRDAAARLATPDTESVSEPLADLTSAFYHQRFAESSGTTVAMAFANRDEQIKLALQVVKKRIDSEVKRRDSDD